MEMAANSFIHRLQLHPQLYGHFLRVMKDFSISKNVDAVVSELDTLFQFHPDLLNTYRVFLPLQFQVLSSPRQYRKKRVINTDDMKILNPCIDFVNKLQKRFADERGVIEAYLYTIRALTEGQLSNDAAYDKIAEIFGDKNQDLVDEFELFMDDDHRSRNKVKKKKKEEEKNNLSSSRKHLSIRMEDEMFELDIHLSHVKKTVKSAKLLMKILTNLAHQEINIDKYFDAVSLSCIKKEQGFSIVQQLREDPKYILPQILSQLKSKKKKLVEDRKKLHERWREILKQKQNSMKKSS